MTATTEWVLTLRGVRGSMPVYSPSVVRHGCNTSCFTIESAAGLILVDAGSGLTSLNEALRQGRHPGPIAILFTHYHLDHLLGLPGFLALYDRRRTIHLYGDGRRDWRSALTRLANPPYWPVPLPEAGANLEFHDLPATGTLSLFGIEVRWCDVAHPQGCLAYRFDRAGASAVIATDREPDGGPRDQALIEFARGADVFLLDAQYTAEEYRRHRGWGHGTWTDAVRMAAASGVGRLVTIHHDPTRSDAELERLEAAARPHFAPTVAAAEGMEFRLGRP